MATRRGERRGTKTLGAGRRIRPFWRVRTRLPRKMEDGASKLWHESEPAGAHSSAETRPTNRGRRRVGHGSDRTAKTRPGVNARCEEAGTGVAIDDG